MMDCFSGVFRRKRVLVTGHTGFKGAWMCEWLLQLGADVAGYSLEPPTTPSMFEELDLQRRIGQGHGDVRDLAVLRATFQRHQPDFVFHLAAQSLVRRSYADPIETFATNILGTANVLEAVRLAERPCVVVVVTSDKAYENREWPHGYREEDAFGGHDPYSASKGATEIVTAAYRRSFFEGTATGISIASARAGNVIGGGDWAADRLVPDCMRSLQKREAILIRNPSATRPWQHVLEPLSGYLWLAARLQLTGGHESRLASGFNFGPTVASNRPVGELVREILRHWPGTWNDGRDPAAVHEANLLGLATDKAFHLLGWLPTWEFAETVAYTVDWYRRRAAGGEMLEFTRAQIAEYVAAARARGISWSK